MASIQEYLKARDSVRNSTETVGRIVREAYDSAQKGLHEGNYDDLGKLADEGSRKKFKNDLVYRLIDHVKPSVEALPEDPLFAETLLMNGFYGFTGGEVSNFIESSGENLTFDGFMKWLQSDQIGYQKALDSRAKATLSILDNVSTNEVIKYVGLTTNGGSGLGSSGSGSSTSSTSSSLSPVSGSSRTSGSPTKVKSPDLISLQDKYELIENFEKFGAIPPDYLKDKPYMK